MNKTKKLWMLGIVPTSIIPFALISCGTTTSTSNETFQAENLTISAKGEIMGFTNPNYNYPETLEIKDKYNGVTITSIADNAFKDKPNLTSLTLPSTLVSIGNQAFANTKLCFVTVPNSVTTIGDNAFMNNSLWYNPNLKLPTKFNNDTQRERIGIRLMVEPGALPSALTQEEVNNIIFGDGPKTSERFREYFKLPKSINDNFINIQNLIFETVQKGNLTLDRELASKTLLSNSVSNTDVPANLVIESIKSKIKDKLPPDYELLPLNHFSDFDKVVIAVKQISGNIADLWNSKLDGILKTKLTPEDQEWISNPKNLIDETNKELHDSWSRKRIDEFSLRNYRFYSGYFGWNYEVIQLNKISLTPLFVGEFGRYFTQEGDMISRYFTSSNLKRFTELDWEINILKLEKKPTAEKEKELLTYLNRNGKAVAKVTIESKKEFNIEVKPTFDTMQTLETFNAKSMGTQISEAFSSSDYSNLVNIIKTIVATKTETEWSFEITWDLIEIDNYVGVIPIYKGGNYDSMFLYDFPTTVVKPIK